MKKRKLKKALRKMKKQAKVMRAEAASLSSILNGQEQFCIVVMHPDAGAGEILEVRGPFCTATEGEEWVEQQKNAGSDKVYIHSHMFPLWIGTMMADDPHREMTIEEKTSAVEWMRTDLTALRRQKLDEAICVEDSTAQENSLDLEQPSLTKREH